MYWLWRAADPDRENPTELGYTPLSALEKGLETGEELAIANAVSACDITMKSKMYSLTDDDFLRLLNELGQKDALIVNVVDIFDFNGSLIPGLHHSIVLWERQSCVASGQ